MIRSIKRLFSYFSLSISFVLCLTFFFFLPCLTTWRYKKGWLATLNIPWIYLISSPCAYILFNLSKCIDFFLCVFLSAKSAVWRAEPQTARREKNLVWPSGIFTEEISLWWGQSSCNENIFLVMYEVSLTRGLHLYWAIIKCYFNFISWLNYWDWSSSIRAEFFEHKVFKYFLIVPGRMNK